MTLLGVTAGATVSASPHPPVSRVEPAGEAREPGLSRGTPLDQYLAANWDAIDRKLQKENGFRGTAGSPAHAAAFDIYLREVGEEVARHGGTEALSLWQPIQSASPADRGGAAAFAGVLRDYASHRYRDDMARATAALIRCRTFELPEVPSPDNPEFVKCRAVVDSLARAHDFEIRSVSGGLGIELAAGSGADTLGIWGHLDVIPADTTGWSFDPWSGRLVDGAIQGRGAQDDKGPFVAAFFALRALRDTGVTLRSRFLLFAGFAEETTFECIDRYLAEQRPPSRNIVIDGSFPVAVGEKGTTWVRVSSSFKRIPLRNCPEGYRIDEFSGGVAPNQVPAYARIRFWPVNRPVSRGFFILKRQAAEWNAENSRSKLSVRQEGQGIVVEATGRAAHGSTPELGHNAIIDLVEFTYELGSTCLQPAHYIVGFLNELVREDISGRGLGIAARDSLMGRTTVNVGQVGSTPDSVWVVLDIRHPRGLSSDQVVRAIREHIDPFNTRYSAGLKVERIGEGLEPFYNDPRSPLVTDLLAAYSEVYGGDEGPASIAGSTYAKKLRGAVSFGPSVPGEPERAHASDEYLTVLELDRLARVYATAAWRLTREK